MTIKPFTTVQFGDYSATKNGNTVFVKDKNNNVKVMEMKDFMKFLAKNVPIIKSQPDKDTFTKSIVSPKEDKPLPGCVKEERPAKYNPLTGEKEYLDITKLLGGIVKDEKPNIPKPYGVIY